MAARRPRRLRRGVRIALVVVVVALLAGGLGLFVRSRQVERSAEALCEKLAQAQDLDQSLTTLDPATLDPRVDALRGAKAVAPADIRSSVTTLADFVSGLAHDVDAAPGDRPTALADALVARQDQVDAVTAAGNEVTVWAQANCGLTLAGTTPTIATP